jgi:NAD(P)-dependent dehydrogenase (short-subunit alcohol dehydrogenase family)
VSEVPLEALREVYETNVVAPLGLVQLALPKLRDSKGILINITSDAAPEAYPGWGAYGSSKSALEGLSRVLAVEEEMVTVWQVDPGDLRTRMHQDAYPGEDISDRPLPSAVAPGLLKLLAERPPSGRYRLAEWA